MELARSDLGTLLGHSGSFGAPRSFLRRSLTRKRLTRTCPSVGRRPGLRKGRGEVGPSPAGAGFCSAPASVYTVSTSASAWSALKAQWNFVAIGSETDRQWKFGSGGIHSRDSCSALLWFVRAMAATRLVTAAWWLALRVPVGGSGGRCVWQERRCRLRRRVRDGPGGGRGPAVRPRFARRSRSSGRRRAGAPESGRGR